MGFLCEFCCLVALMVFRFCVCHRLNDVFVIRIVADESLRFSVFDFVIILIRSNNITKL